IVETYDRSTLINDAVDNLSVKLLEEFIVVAIVCLLFLFHIRSAFVAIVTLPLGILLAFIIMRWQGVNANIMSLGGIAIAIGAMIDAAVVMIENTHKHLESWQQENKSKEISSTEHWHLITKAATEVGPALFFSLLIITLSFLPVFTLQAQEGRLFTPLAFTKTYAMAMAAALAITVIPVLMGYFIRGKIPEENANPINRYLIQLYQASLEKVLLKPVRTLVIALLLLLTIIIPVSGISSLLVPFNWQSEFTAGWNNLFTNSPIMKRLATGLGSEFMPPMNEGDLMYMPTTLPGISIGKAQQLLQQTDRLIKSVPEVKKVFGKMGRADTATDPAPLTMIETIIQLKPKDQWRAGMTLEKLIDELDETVNLPGLTNAWLMPIKTRIDMLATGIKTPVGVKISGPDLKVIDRIGRRLEKLLMEIPGTRSAYSERVTGGRYVQVLPDRIKAAFLGVSIAEINHVISAAVGGINVSQLVEGAERYPINIRFAREVRDDLDKLRALPVITKSGAEIALASVAEIKIVDGAPMIKSENARRSGWTFVDIHKTDLGSYIEKAQKIVQEKLYLPSGYSISWTGQYEYMLRAQEKLKTVIPVTLVIVLLLLYLTFGRIGEALLVMTTLPFAVIGGFWLLFVLNYHLSIATAVGFIALLGVAAEFGVVMLVYLNVAVKEKIAAGQLNNKSDLKQAIIQGAVLRVRPKAMTVAVIVAGLLPIMFGDGAGSEVMQRIAAPMIGGMITAPLLSLFVIPVVYLIWKGRELK
ncbi:MAG: efflux RND transporter permease subunit, partial [Gammaproteobacteria bacterium]|nr:efflux RND transporter permease subunit [Gammaproteobacteria bacterium]